MHGALFEVVFSPSRSTFYSEIQLRFSIHVNCIYSERKTFRPKNERDQPVHTQFVRWYSVAMNRTVDILVFEVLHSIEQRGFFFLCVQNAFFFSFGWSVGAELIAMGRWFLVALQNSQMQKYTSESHSSFLHFKPARQYVVCFCLQPICCFSCRHTQHTPKSNTRYSRHFYFCSIVCIVLLLRHDFD